MSDEEKASFRRTLLDEVLTTQDKEIRAAVDEFLGRVTAPKTEIKVGSKRIEVEPARLLRSARFENRPTFWSGWIVYNGSSWTCDGPLTADSSAVFLRDDGAIFARAGEAGGLLSSSNKHLSEHHQVVPHPDDTSSRGMYGKLPVWCMRTAGANLGLPLNVHVHNQVHPEISVGRWCSGTANALTVHCDFDELISADATATSTWFIRRLAAVLDHPHTRREFWGRAI